MGFENGNPGSQNLFWSLKDPKEVSGTRRPLGYIKASISGKIFRCKVDVKSTLTGLNSLLLLPPESFLPTHIFI
jgi:hypothetical protein